MILPYNNSYYANVLKWTDNIIQGPYTYFASDIQISTLTSNSAVHTFVILKTKTSIL